MNKYIILKYLLQIHSEILEDAQNLHNQGLYTKSNEKIEQCKIINKIYDYIYNND